MQEVVAAPQTEVDVVVTSLEVPPNRLHQMWNSYWSGRARRDVPQVNYNESSEEEEFNSPLVSPRRPPPTREGSPVLLSIPTLGDNIDEELAAVSQTLNNVGHTHTFRGTRPTPGSRPEPEGVENPPTR